MFRHLRRHLFHPQLNDDLGERGVLDGRDYFSTSWASSLLRYLLGMTYLMHIHMHVYQHEDDASFRSMLAIIAEVEAFSNAIAVQHVDQQLSDDQLILLD